MRRPNKPHEGQISRCVICGYQMVEDEVWISDNTKDNRIYCFSHAPDDSIRHKDIIWPKEGGMQ